MMDAYQERHDIQALRLTLAEILDESDTTPDAQAIAAIMTAARYVARARIPVDTAVTMLVDYILRGEPV